MKGLTSSPSRHTLAVSATDGGGLVSSTNARVTVSVVDIGQNVPQFTQSLYRFEVAENVDTGTPVGSVGVDKESTGEGELAHTMVGGGVCRGGGGCGEEGDGVVCSRSNFSENLKKYVTLAFFW